MSQSAARAAAVASARKNIHRVRKNDRYVDDPEEQAALLEEELEEGGFPHNNQREEPPAQVRHFGTVHSTYV